MYYRPCNERYLLRATLITNLILKYMKYKTYSTLVMRSLLNISLKFF